MSSNIKIISVTADRRILTAGGVTGFDDDPTDAGGASNPSLIAVAEIDAALHGSNGANGTSVVVSTQSGEGEEGDITFDASSPLTYTNTVARSLTLNAARDVILNADILPGIAAGPLDLRFSASFGTFNPNSGLFDVGNSNGNVVMGPGVTLDSNGGSIVLLGGAAERHSLQGTIRSGGGAVNVSGAGVTLAGDLSIAAGAGGISVTGGIDGARDLVLDAAGAAVTVTGTIGSATRLTGLGVAGTSATLSTVNADELAVNLTGANARVVVTNNGAMRIGTFGSISGISTNTGNVSLTASGLLAIDAAISTAGTAAPADIGQGLQTGAVTLGGGGISLGADIRTDGGAVTLSSPVTVTATNVTIDTDQAAGGNAGNVSFIGTINGAVAGQNTLIVDARETTPGLGSGASVTFANLIGAATRLGALGVGAGSVTFTNGGGGNDVDTLAIALTGGNNSINFTDRAGLTIGSVGSLNGITTNTGNVIITVTGDLLVAKAIDTTGTAPAGGGASGLVQLSVNGGNLTISDKISGANAGGNAVILGAAGTTTIGAAITARTGNISITSNNGIGLGADLQTDGGNVSLTGATTITAPLVTIDTDRTAGGNAGNVTFTSAAPINGAAAGQNALFVDARETGTGGGLGGNVTFSGLIGATARLGALGVAAGGVGFNNGSGGNDIGTLARALSGANQAVSFTDRAGLTIGSVGSLNGITTNTGNVIVTAVTGDLLVAQAIDTTGTAAALGSNTGVVQLTASSGNLTISDTISGAAAPGGNGVSLSASGAGSTTVNAEITARTGNIAIGGSGGIALGADLQTDGGNVSLTNPTRITLPLVTIDTDRTAGGNAGNVTLSTGSGINGTLDGANTLIIDARETESGSGLGGGVSLGVIGATTRLGALGIGGGTVGFNNSGNANRIDTLAIELTGANRFVALNTASSLTIGEVGPFSGITTNSGNVFLTVTGNLTVAKAIHTVGPAPAGDSGQGMQAGLVQLTATGSGNLTISDTITGAATSGGNPGIVLSAAATATVNAKLTATTGGVQFSSTGGTIRLGADLQTDGGFVSLGSNQAFLTAATVRIDTDLTAGGNAGGVTLGPISGDGASPRTLLIDARDTGAGGGAGGQVSFTGAVGGVNRLGALGIGAGNLSFSSSANSIDMLAVELTNANRGFGVTVGASLTIGEAGPYSGIKTNSGTVGIAVTSGNLTIAKAINTIGAAPPGDSGQGFQSGIVSLNAQNGNLTISDTITARGIGPSGPITAIGLASSGITTVNAKLTALAGFISFSGAGSTVLGANLQTDGGVVSLGNAVTLTAPTVTIDTDQTAGGAAGGVSISSQGIKSDVAGTRSLIIDARETGSDAGGSVSFFGGVGGAGRLAGLGVGAGAVGFNNTSGANNIGTLAIELSNANAGFFLLTTGPLTIGSVGPFTGIKTNFGNVNISVESGTLTVAEAISTIGTAAPTSGFVTLSTNNATLTVSNTITSMGANLTANGTGTIAVNADIDARTGSLTLNAPNDGAVRLGADLQTDGTQISLIGATTLTIGDVTLDTDASLGGNAGNVTVTGTIDGSATTPTRSWSMRTRPATGPAASSTSPA